MIGTHSVRIARSSDFNAVSNVLLASYSNLLADRYGRDLLEIALPFMTKANATLLASGTYYVAESNTGTLVGCGGWSREQPGSELPFKAKGTSAILRHTLSRWDGESGVRCSFVA